MGEKRDGRMPRRSSKNGKNDLKETVPSEGRIAQGFDWTLVLVAFIPQWVRNSIDPSNRSPMVFNSLIALGWGIFFCCEGGMSSKTRFSPLSTRLITCIYIPLLL
jgi:hypothetical protein